MVDMNFRRLAQAVGFREPEWGTEPRCPLFAACELGGEVGEVLNEVKKLDRWKKGLVGGKELSDDLADELGDVVICCELLARKYGIDLGQAVATKFNKTSEKHGMKTKIL